MEWLPSNLPILWLGQRSKYRGEVEERPEAIVEKVTNDTVPPTILFIEGIHTIRSADGGIETANILKPALARGKLQVFGG